MKAALLIAGYLRSFKLNIPVIKEKILNNESIVLNNNLNFKLVKFQWNCTQSCNNTNNSRRSFFFKKKYFSKTSLPP
jgi:hypothetical protein